MNYKIVLAKESDFPEIFTMIKDLAVFENAGDKVINTIERMKQEQALFKCLLAVDNSGKVMGMALYFYAYFTWVGKSLYLEDLYVKPDFRRMGVGEALLKEIIAIAKQENCKRLRWQVLSWNENAINLYKKIGATIDAGWCNCDIHQN